MFVELFVMNHIGWWQARCSAWYYQPVCEFETFRTNWNERHLRTGHVWVLFS